MAEGRAVVSRLVWCSQHLARQAVLPGDRRRKEPVLLPGISSPAAAEEAYWVYRLMHNMPPAGLDPLQPTPLYSKL